MYTCSSPGGTRGNQLINTSRLRDAGSTAGLKDFPGGSMATFFKFIFFNVNVFILVG